MKQCQSPKTVRVRSYWRIRLGRPEFVQAHTRCKWGWHQ